MLSLSKSLFIRSVSIFFGKWTGVKTCPFNVYVDSPGGIGNHSIEKKKKNFEKQWRLISYLE